MQQKALQELERDHERIVRLAEDKERHMESFVDSINTNKEAMADIIGYFSDDYSTYINQKLEKYYLSDSLSGIDFKSSARSFYSNDPSYKYSEITKEDLSLTYKSDFSQNITRYFITSRPLTLSKNDRQIGTISSFFDFSDFSTIVNSRASTSVVIIAPNGQLLWTSTNLSLPNKTSARFVLDSQEEKPMEIRIENQPYYYSDYVTKNQTRLITLMAVPTIRDFFDFRSFGFLILFLLVLSFFIYLLRRFFKQYTAQIDSIVEGMSLKHPEVLTSYIPLDDKKGELFLVTDSFNQLLERINTYVEKNYLLEIKQKEAELRSLQSQINPHFLYNTLEFIRMSALKQGETDLSEMVYILGQLFRNTMAQQKETTLYEEVENSLLYMKLFQTKYPNKIAYQFILNPDVEKLVLPKFIIQPLIENYVLHGIDYKKSNNVIQLKAFRKDHALYIQLTDNGKGISPEKLSIMKNYLSNQADLLTSVGFKNVNERLKLFFGEDYRMIISSTPHVETKIQLIIPLSADEPSNSI